MSHKFKGIWHCFLLIGNTLQPKGTMDLNSITSLGNIPSGVHHDPDATPPDIGIKGSAFGLGPIFQLTLENEAHDRYEGTLAHESADGQKFVIVGKKTYGNKERQMAESKDQDDPPWVITKP